VQPSITHPAADGLGGDHARLVDLTLAPRPAFEGLEVDDHGDVGLLAPAHGGVAVVEVVAAHVDQGVGPPLRGGPVVVGGEVARLGQGADGCGHYRPRLPVEVGVEAHHALEGRGDREAAALPLRLHLLVDHLGGGVLPPQVEEDPQVAQRQLRRLGDDGRLHPAEGVGVGLAGPHQVAHPGEIEIPLGEGRCGLRHPIERRGQAHQLGGGVAPHPGAVAHEGDGAQVAGRLIGAPGDDLGEMADRPGLEDGDLAAALHEPVVQLLVGEAVELARQLCSEHMFDHATEV
jgi:hypothetical protein